MKTKARGEGREIFMKKEKTIKDKQHLLHNNY